MVWRVTDLAEVRVIGSEQQRNAYGGEDFAGALDRAGADGWDLVGTLSGGHATAGSLIFWRHKAAG